MSTTAPNGLNPQEIPQMVFLTFDDAVTDENHHVYDRVAYWKIESIPMAATSL